MKFARKSADRPTALFLGALLVSVMIAASAGADTLVLSDGRKLQGTVTEDGGEYIVRSTGGIVTRVPKYEVVQRLKSDTPLQSYKRRLKGMESEAKPTADAWYKLGTFARKNKLTTEAKAAFERAIEIDLDHALARSALGYTKAGDEWVKTKPKSEKTKDTGTRENTPRSNRPARRSFTQPATTGSGLRKINWIHCPKCSGTKVEIWLDCLQCDQSEKPGYLFFGQYMTKCNRCWGKTKLPGLRCRYCKGRGKIDADNPPVPKQRRIPAGYTQCFNCAGTGCEHWLPCTQCSRSKWKGLLYFGQYLMICNRCHGKGRLPGLKCGQCRGSGNVRE